MDSSSLEPEFFSINQIIGEIYRVASDSDQWQELIKRIFLYLEESGHFEENEIHAISQHTPTANTWKEALQQTTEMAPVIAQTLDDTNSVLLAHFNNALQLIWKISQYQEMENLSYQLYDKLPIGLVMFTDESIVFSNKFARALFPISSSIDSLYNFFNEPEISSWFRASLKDLRHVSNQKSYFCNLFEYNGSKLTVHLCNSNNENLHILFLGGVNDFISSAHPVLDTLNLSCKEAEVTLGLTGGRSVKQIAEMTSKSEHTVRTQVKSILMKNNINRQSDLIQLVSNVPFFDNKMKQDIPSLHVLPSGRKLAYNIYGEDNKKNVLYLHSGVGSRLELPPFIIEKLVVSGYRLICVDRPNFGYSDVDRNLSFESIASDMVALVVALGCKRVSLIGYTMGGVIAAKMAVINPAMIEKLFLICTGCQPSQAEIDQHYYMYRMGFKMLTHFPKLYMGISAIIKHGVKRNPDNFLKDHIAPMTKTEQTHEKLPWMKEHLKINLLEVVRSDNKLLATAQEGYLYANKWCFSLSQIQHETYLLLGDEDQHTPAALGIKMAGQLENGEYEIMKGYGTFLMFLEQEYVAKKIISFLDSK